MKSETEEEEEELKGNISDFEEIENKSIQLESKTIEPINGPQNYYWNGVDYCNVYTKDFQNIEEFNKGNT
jgi:hypothetical protein